jgi:hypothetical protein
MRPGAALFFGFFGFLGGTGGGRVLRDDPHRLLAERVDLCKASVPCIAGKPVHEPFGLTQKEQRVRRLAPRLGVVTLCERVLCSCDPIPGRSDLLVGSSRQVAGESYGVEHLAHRVEGIARQRRAARERDSGKQQASHGGDEQTYLEGAAVAPDGGDEQSAFAGRRYRGSGQDYLKPLGNLHDLG